MKKLLALVAGLMTYSAVYALPVYNPDQPELLKYGVFTAGDDSWGLEFGYRGDFVFDRKIKHDNNGNLAAFQKDLPNYRRTINAGQLTINFWDRIDLYGWAGAAQSEFETEVNFLPIAVGPASGLVNLRGSTKEEFAWGVGARAILWQCGRTAVGVDGQYANTNGKLRSLTVNGAPVQAGFLNPDLDVAADPANFRLKNREWQVSLGISHRICFLVPYVAVKYSNARPRFSGELLQPNNASAIAAGTTYDPSLKLKNRGSVGFVAGVTIVDADRMHVTAEGRFIDERALTVAADFRF